MRHYKWQDILPFLEDTYTTAGQPDGKYFTHVKPILEAGEDALVWINPSRADKQNLAENTRARMIICDSEIKITNRMAEEKLFILVKHPKLVFTRIVTALFERSISYGIHPTAYVHPEAEIHSRSYIGPFTYVGKSTIGEGSVIYGHVHIYDGVIISRNVTIHAGCIIGADGFGYSRNEAGVLEKFPHIGSVHIDDHVEIGANTCIDRGALGQTWIKEGAKIDNLVHIAHNVVVGRHAAVIALAMIAGSVELGDYSWIAPSAAIREVVKVGRQATVGIGAVVTKNIPDGETWTGVPARPLDEFLAIQKALKSKDTKSS